uniref:N-acetyllactosaminide beta-1,3-N-acetylglucosaminyltransferase n=1 Tax=Parastrongyloides trichosuri TaxID=131310 RepID=A0A0N4ZBP4_PARTI
MLLLFSGFVFYYNFDVKDSSQCDRNVYVKQHKEIRKYTINNYKDFSIIPNIIKGLNYSYENNIVLILHISSDQPLQKIKNHLYNWEGFISLSVYITTNTIFSYEFICTFCKLKAINENYDKLSVHFVFNKMDNENFINDVISRLLNNICNDKNKIFYLSQSCIKEESNKKNISYTMSKYPANVLRNVARNYSYSKYILLGDVDHMFSKHFHKKMLKIAKDELNEKNKKALVYRIFEIDTINLTTAPMTKVELKKQIKEKKAFVFHHYYKGAHSIPRLEEWLDVDDSDCPKIQFEAEYDRSHWEPQFVSLNTIPYHDEHFPYPNRDNTVLRWEMCRAGYKFLIVNDVFMFHLGLKNNKESKAVSVAKEMSRKEYDHSLINFRKSMDIKYPLTIKNCPF